MMEHIVASSLSRHFEQNDILYDLQQGFRERRSCETQLVEELARNTSRQTGLILLDFSKALGRVTSEAIAQTSPTWCKRQCSVLDKGLSDWALSNSCTVGRKHNRNLCQLWSPSRICVGPLFILLYINDLQQIICSQV